MKVRAGGEKGRPQSIILVNMELRAIPLPAPSQRKIARKNPPQIVRNATSDIVQSVESAKQMTGLGAIYAKSGFMGGVSG